MGLIDSVNIGRAEPNPFTEIDSTGINKLPQAGRVEVRAPGPRAEGFGSGLVGDFVGDRRNHGGDHKAVYAFQREDLDAWSDRLDRELPNGFFGENLTTTGVDINASVLGEIWRVGETELRVTTPRFPCNTFRGWVGEKGWLRLFTLDARPGVYFEVLTPGTIGAGDAITVLHRPDHDVTISLVYRAMTTDRDLLPNLLAAGDDLPRGIRATVASDRAGS